MFVLIGHRTGAGAAHTIFDSQMPLELFFGLGEGFTPESGFQGNLVCSRLRSTGKLLEHSKAGLHAYIGGST